MKAVEAAVLVDIVTLLMMKIRVVELLLKPHLLWEYQATL
jgi:hypothetical protein